VSAVPPCPTGARLLDQVGLGVVTRQQLGLALGDFRELTFEGFGECAHAGSRLGSRSSVL
jgi:hypothetical protein